MSVKAFLWKKTHLDVLDQRLLPHKVKFIKCKSSRDVAHTIRHMAVRGAPAIGCVAAYGMALAAHRGEDLKKAARILKTARPTAVNLAWAVDRVLRTASSPHVSVGDPGIVDSRLRGNDELMEKEAIRIEKEDIANNKKMGEAGSRLFKNNSVVLTHCNAGSLATAGYGTSLGVVRSLKSHRKLKKLFVNETRPYLQGARLTAWECVRERIPHELITDNMDAFFMKSEKISGVIVGCDRVAANGDTANKIGTYGLAVLARYHMIPFYVAMPLSTLDLNLVNGSKIPIEDRSSDEVVLMHGKSIAPTETKARHPAFDVTPASLITAIITERGVIKPPYIKNLKNILKSRHPGEGRDPQRMDSGLRHSGMTGELWIIQKP